MERIKLGDLVVPVSNIDTVFINDIDKKKLCVYTLGGYTVNFKFDTEEICKDNFDIIVDIIDKYQPGMIIKVADNGKDREDNKGSR